MTELAALSGRGWRLFGWSAALALILAPLVAMRLDVAGVNWSPADFVFAIAMIGGIGLALEWTMRRSGSWAWRGGCAFALLAGFLLVWSNLAVGYVGDEDNAYNLLFFAVIAVALGGSIVARFRPAGMARAMLAAGLVHAAVGLGGAAVEPITAPITVGFCLLWFGAAWLLRRAAISGLPIR